MIAVQRSDTHGLLRFHLYVTGPIAETEKLTITAHHLLGVQDPITGLRSLTRFGRPRWDELFAEWGDRCRGERIGVFFCGPKLLSRHLRSLCGSFSTSTTTFNYYEESF